VKSGEATEGEGRNDAEKIDFEKSLCPTEKEERNQERSGGHGHTGGAVVGSTDI